MIIEWEDTSTKENVSDAFHVHVNVEGILMCNNIGSALTDWTHCADFTTKKSCTEACGLATGGATSYENRYGFKYYWF